MRTHRRKGGGISDEEAEGITKPVFAEYRTDDHASSQDRTEPSKIDGISGTEDGQVPMAGEVMNQYIITEELLQPIEEIFYPVSSEERQRLSEYARSHPYNPQAEDIDEWCKLHEEVLKDIRTEAYRSGFHDGEKAEREIPDVLICQSLPNEHGFCGKNDCFCKELHRVESGDICKWMQENRRQEGKDRE